MTPQTIEEPMSVRPAARPRVVYITHRVPYPPDKGDRIRNYHLLRQLARVADVSLAALADEPVPEKHLEVLNGLSSQVANIPVSKKRRWARAGVALLSGKSLSEGAFHEPELTRVVDEWLRAAPADAVVVSASSLVPYLQRGRLRGVPAFVDLVDVDSQKWADFAAASRGPKRLLYEIESRQLRKLEAGLAGTVAGVSLVSRAEADLYDAFTSPGSATVATNGVDLDYFTPVEGETVPACAFVGALDYLPNVDAAVWFAHEVWPAVRERNPSAEFWLIGRKPAPDVQALASEPGVKLIGQVPDVRPHLGRAAMAVVPMRLSRGLQNKVLEALAMGKATIAAPPALAALKVEPGRHLLEARTPEDWVESISLLLADAGMRQSLGRAGRQFVEENHHWDRCLAPLTDMVLAACRK